MESAGIRPGRAYVPGLVPGPGPARPSRLTR